MLRSHRRHWQVTGAVDPRDAALLLAAQNYDAVVTDVAMGPVDGAALLRRIRDETPGCARIVLSDDTERAAALRAAGVAHEVLIKPAGPDELRRTLASALDLQRRLARARLPGALGGLCEVPGPGPAIAALNAALDDPDATVAGVSGVVGADPALAARVLGLVNSPLFGLPRPVADPGTAVAYLGTGHLRAVVALDLLDTLSGRDDLVGLAAALREHAAAVLGAVRRLLGARPCPPELFIAALLHDVGILAIAALLPDTGRRLAALGTDGWGAAAEMELMGATHADIGAFLASRWGLPHPVVGLIARHTDDDVDPGGDADGVLRRADRLCAASDPAPAATTAGAVDHFALAEIADVAEAWLRGQGPGGQR
jgi:HD-like signal output (HDOD) protein